MNKALSWKVLLLLGAVAWVFARLVGGVIGDFVGLFADIVLAVGVIYFFVSLVKRKGQDEA